MATQTSNLGLTKPGYDEAADVVPAVNNNMDTLDSKIGAVPANTSVQAQITSNTQAIGNLSNLTTTEKGSLVGAANELNSNITTLNNNVSDMKGHFVNGRVSNNGTVSAIIASDQEIYFMYRSFQPNMLRITSTGAVEICFGKNEAITISVNDGTMTIQNNLGWAFNYVMFIAGN